MSIFEIIRHMNVHRLIEEEEKRKKEKAKAKTNKNRSFGPFDERPRRAGGNEGMVVKHTEKSETPVKTNGPVESEEKSRIETEVQREERERA